MIYEKVFDKFKDYLDVELSDTFISIIENDIINSSIDEFIEKQLHYLDCTRWDRNHKHRLMQTIGVPYKIEMSKLVYGVTTFSRDKSDYVANKILEIHKNNLEYEKENPPEIYKDKKVKPTKTNDKKPKEKKEKTPKLTKEEKFKQKIQGLNFNIKI